MELLKGINGALHFPVRVSPQIDRNPSFEPQDVELGMN